MTVPLVSVLMPVYNAERYVGDAVDSVLAQTFADFEFVIIDDGSTDGSPAILRERAARDARIRLVSRENTGYVRALNEGLALSRGEFVARMDADDVALANRLALQVEYLGAHSDYLAVGGQLQIIDEDGAALGHERLPLAHDEIDASTLRGANSIAHPAAMIRRRALVELGGYRSAYYGAEDKDLWLRLAECGRLANLPNQVLKLRVHPANYTFVNYERSRAALAAAIADACRRRGLPCPVEPASAVARSVGAWERRLAWAWSAVESGNSAAARKHAWALFRHRFWSRDAWVVLTYAWLGSRAESLRRWFRRMSGRTP